MIVPGSVNPLLLATGGYDVPYSLRFRRANSAYLSRTPASTGNQQVMTFSWWMKIGELPSANQVKVIFASGAAGSNPFFAIGFNDPNNAGGNVPLRMSIVEGTSSVLTSLASDMLFRDPSAWYHCVVAIDTTQATSTNRVKLYVNGTQQTLGGTTTYGTSGVYPSLNANINYNTSTYATLIGKSSYLSQYFDGYLAEMNFIDGQALTPSSFGQTDSATGVWVPKKYSGTYGTNGFYLKFADATSTTTIGNDSSGNGNNFTSSGISVTSGVTFDQMLDTPTLNYATGNAVFIPSTNFLVDFRAANLEWGQAASNKNCSGVASIDMRTGKWYWETTVGTVAGNITFGVSRSDLNSTFRGTGTVYYRQDGQKVVDGVNSAYGASYVANDVLGFAYDADAGTLTCYKNNSSQGTITITSGSSYGWFPACALDNAGAGVTAFHTYNFGQRAFVYTPPSGFKALNTANLPTPSIKKGSLYMDATLRTGTGATASVSSLGFQPDLVWIKSRSAATDHGLYDAVRGVQLQLESNTTTDETTETTGLTAFSSNGYTVGALAQLNTNTATYVDWAWKEGVTPGFDIVTYTGNGVARTISHTLGAAPKFMIVKARSTASTDQGWPVYHAANTAAPETDYLLLNSTAATADLDTVWNDTAPTASVFSVGTNALVNANADTYVAYLWSEIEGFSKFGSYTGNASTDGSFNWCGFRPRFLLLKNSSVVSYWIMLDSVRNTVNVVTDELLADTSNAENGLAITSNVDFLASGFKIRTSDANLNQSGNTIIFAAFAENPFKYARAR